MYPNEKRITSTLSYSPAVDVFPQGQSQETLMQKTNRAMQRMFGFYSNEYNQSSFRIRLYRFMAESIPIIGSVIWTWSRLAAAPGEFELTKGDQVVVDKTAEEILDDLFRRSEFAWKQ